MIRSQCNIACITPRATGSNVGLDGSRNEDAGSKVQHPALFYVVGIDMDTTICDTRSGASNHRGVDERAVLDHRILAYDDVDAASNRFRSIRERTRTCDIGGDDGVVQDKLAASDEHGASTIAAHINDRLLRDLN